jgi:ATP-dependent Clp protease ATP-binding subunit ClpA
MSIFEQYAEKARRTMHLAKCEADRFGSTEVNTEHILLALVNDSALVVDSMRGVSESEIRDAINVHIPRGEPNPLPHDLPLSEQARRAVGLAREEADKVNQKYVQNEHVLLALIQSTSFAAQLLNQKGLSADKLRLHIRTLPQPEEGHNPATESKESRAEVELIRKVGEFVSRGKGPKALQMLDDFMSEPGQDRKLRVRMMATLRNHGFADWRSQHRATLLRGAPSL